MRMYYIKILPGDRVSVEMSPYDLSKGRITTSQIISFTRKQIISKKKFRRQNCTTKRSFNVSIKKNPHKQRQG